MPRKPSGSVSSPSGLTKAVRAIGEATGVSAIARAALDAEEGLIERLTDKARRYGVSEKRIAEALRAKRKYDRAMSIVALLYPFVPNPALLRLVAGKPSPKPRTGTRRP